MSIGLEVSICTGDTINCVCRWSTTRNPIWWYQRHCWKQNMLLWKMHRNRIGMNSLGYGYGENLLYQWKSDYFPPCSVLASFILSNHWQYFDWREPRLYWSSDIPCLIFAPLGCIPYYHHYLFVYLLVSFVFHLENIIFFIRVILRQNKWTWLPPF